MTALGFDIQGDHIVLSCSMTLSQKMSKLLDMGIYVVGFYFPVVPKESRIRVNYQLGIQE